MAQDARTIEEGAAARRAQVLNLSYIDTSKIQKQLYQALLSVPELYKFRVIPLVADEHYIHFGVTNTTSQQTITDLSARFSDQRLDFSLISDSGFNEYMKLYDPPKQVHYQNIEFSQASSESERIIKEVSSTLEQVRPDDMLAYLVQQAYKLKASDIHLENMRTQVRVRFRVDGVLHAIAYIHPDTYRHMIAALASSANLSTSEKNPQTGHISRNFKMANGDEVTLNLRVETVMSVYGIDAVMRLFNMKLELFKLENLGLSLNEMNVVDEIINHPTGLVLVVGPTGSGKTTTLYSLINTLNTPERKIITLEDPVEYNMPGVSQIPVEGQLGRQDFAENLRAILRLDPDIVMVGEIRDEDTAKTALQAALTGHLVLSTFHAGSAAEALTRLMDLVGQNPLFTNAIRLVMAQRLVRRLDDATKKPYQPDEIIAKPIEEVINSLPPGSPKPDLGHLTLYKPGSSPENPFGYSGQLAIREQMLMSPGVRKLLTQPPQQISNEELQKQAVADGMRTMLQDGVLKAIAGETTIEEIYRVVS